MYSRDAKLNKLFLLWLFSSLLLVIFIIVVGGLTRLTNSGLSIIEWELLKGILPPLNTSTWNTYFEKYKTIPQYNLLNSDMTLGEFKIIFYWEYFHRILARVIGIFFLLPLIYFYLTKKIKREILNKCLIIFTLILFQGFIGWYMVKSGLVNLVSVSHYRLSLHLTFAIIIASSLFWLLRNNYNLRFKYRKFFQFNRSIIPFQFLIILIFLQIIIGAFVSGLDAGKIYQTWPLMGESYVPNDIIFKNISSFFDFNSHSLTQFYHRNIAYFIIFYVLILLFFIIKYKMRNLFKPILILFLLMLIQVILGVFTLISGLNLYLASAHQINSVLLVFSAINLYFFCVK